MADSPAVEDIETFLPQLMGSITDFAVIRLDGTGVVRSWHAGAQQLTQYMAEEIIGRPAALFYTAQDAAHGLPETDLRAAGQAGSLMTSGWRVRRDGAQFWASVVTTALHDQAGAARGHGMVIRDQTQWREQELALHSVEQMLGMPPAARVSRRSRRPAAGHGRACGPCSPIAARESPTSTWP